jgi:hypothetical protein
VLDPGRYLAIDEEYTSYSGKWKNKAGFSLGTLLVFEKDQID